MSTLISLDSVSHLIGNKQLFTDLKLAINDDSRLGIIGPNGSGKSTLMKILAEEITPDSGRVVRGRSVRVAYVPQMDNFDIKKSAEEVMVEELSKSFTDLEATTRAGKFLGKVGFEDFNQKVGDLSGGWRKRLALAVALASEPEVLLLDEPTNHLDLAGLLWLETLLNNANFAWALISHDRYFLEQTVKEVMEVAPCYKNGILKLGGSYEVFLEKRAEFLDQEAKGIASLANKVRNEQEWASRAPKARGTKANYRMKETDRLDAELRERKSRVTGDTAKVSFTSSNRQTKELVEFINVSFGFGDLKILTQESFIVNSGVCLGVLGINGQGKSTVLKLIGGALEPESGKVKRAGHLKVVYFDQLRGSLSNAKTLRDGLADGYDQVVYQGKSTHIISWGKKFGFDPADHDKQIKNLSGGEQARLLLSILVRQEADLLILDEPTNDLDLPMLETLEAILMDFPGAVILVTHDRYMLDKVCTNYIGFDQEQKLLSFASYSQWQESRARVQHSKEVRGSGSIPSIPVTKKMSPEDLREYGQMEKKIIKAEQELALIEDRAVKAANANDHHLMVQMANELKVAQEKVEGLYQRWDQLETLSGKL